MNTKNIANEYNLFTRSNKLLLIKRFYIIAKQKHIYEKSEILA